MYKEAFDAMCGFLITGSEIPVKIKRLCNRTHNILHSASDSVYRFLAIAQFDKSSSTFTSWFEDNPFDKEYYWKT